MTARRALIIGGGVLAVLLLVVVAAGLALQAGALDGWLLRNLSARVRHPVSVEGPLRIRLFSSRPRVVAEKLVVGNPPWMPRGELGRVERFELVFAPGLAHPLRIERAELHGARLTPRRLDDGRSNWQLDQAEGGRAARLPAIRGLIVRDARMDLDDRRRDLTFKGTLETAGTAAGPGAPFRLRIGGELNGREMQAELSGDALGEVSPRQPYAFRFEERSGKTRFTGEGQVLRPFDLSRIDFRFEAEGPNLRELYYLTGVHLPATGGFQLEGRLERRQARFRFHGLRLSSGGSDLEGELTADSAGERRRLQGELHSRTASLADICERAARGGRTAPPGPQPRGRRIPDEPLPLDLLRERDVDLEYTADEWHAGPFGGRRLSARLTSGEGRAQLAPLVTHTRKGRVEGRLELDLRAKTPAARLRLDFHDADFGELMHGRRDPPPLEGPVRGHVDLRSSGATPRALAAAAEGRIALGLDEGEVRAALAEVLKLDLGAVGLAMSKSRDSVPLRCGVARLAAERGQLRIEQLVFDTEPTVLKGEGTIDLAQEQLALELTGQPKEPRLRLRGSLMVGGSFAQPAPRLERRAARAQGVAAAALATVVAPVAAAAAFVDPGRGKDLDCEELLGALDR